MASSGTITGTTSNEFITCKIEWTQTRYDDLNQSNIKAALWYKSTNTGYETYGTFTGSIKIGSYTVSLNKTLTITSEWTYVSLASTRVDHNDDGTCSINISATGAMSGTTLSSTSCGKTVTLDTIPRAATISGAANKTLGSACSVTWKPLASNHKYKIKFSLGNWNLTTGYITPSGTSSYNWSGTTIPLEAANYIGASAKTGTVTATLYTYTSGGTQIGDASSKTFTVTIPDNSSTKPTVTMSLSPVSSLASPFNSLYIKGRSKVDANFTNGEGKYGATVTSYKMSVGIKSYGDPWTSEYLTAEGTVTVTGTITNSRGFVRTYTQNINVIPYASPRILPASGESEIVCARCDENGNLSDSGTYLKIKAKRSYSKVVSDGTQNNFCYIRYRYKAEGGSYSSWATILATGAAADEIETGALLGGNLSLTSTYAVQVGVVDTMGETETLTIGVPSELVYMHRAGSIRSLGIGKYVEEENMVDVAEDITTKFRGKVRFAGEAWTNLGLSENVAESESDCGRWGGTGCYYRVCAGEKHICVAFNCAFTFSGTAIQVNAEPIPAAYRPDRNVYAMCATEGRAVARILVNKSGYILVDWIQVITATESTTSSTVKWIDGYIDYWT